jgi:hypothetical protein
LTALGALWTRADTGNTGLEAMDPLSAILITISLGGIAGAVYAAQIEARHQRHIGTDHHEDYTCGWQ